MQAGSRRSHSPKSAGQLGQIGQLNGSWGGCGVTRECKPGPAAHTCQNLHHGSGRGGGGGGSGVRDEGVEVMGVKAGQLGWLKGS